LNSIDDPARLADTIAAHMPLKLADKQSVLEMSDVNERLEYLMDVFVMGAIAGLICSPCTTAPLSAILLYIAQSGNMWLGGGTLYL
ncbi:LON peptidase substrate-binding domain-containing protein, partial [Salmonella enterica subsp. enterica serovar Montevideo]|nr:LON peptidase substrate-binding domain-containing protein [Salmonella enterica subsp. enterica serovar Montevideo]